MNKLIASLFGIGYIKGGGTYASIFTCVVLYFLWQVPAVLMPLPNVLIGLAILLIGIYTGNKVEPFWGKDSYRVVIDEVAGMWITMLFVPVNNIKLLVAGLILFRFFDMVKPLGVRRMEALKGGLGVMMDDVLAGVYANITLQVLVFSGLLK
ncbi:phosphatidylglycerophosphatase A [Mucilaginibacter defluvii]|uniref:Phosphatidylglycerophosphatase A n=1 Tax=Mucilaginibacter defluvii TaxID=1196019 RepID=A0ABP9G3L7_9SPHI